LNFITMTGLVFMLIAFILTGGASPLAAAGQKTEMEAASVQKPGQALTQDEWIVAEEDRCMPVIDELGVQLQASRRSFVQNDMKAASSHIRKGALYLGREQKLLTNQSHQKIIADAAFALDQLARDVEGGKITSLKELDPSLQKAYQADIDHRWLFARDLEWLPVVEVPQRHFKAARVAFERKDKKTAGGEIRKGAAFLRLEAARAEGESRSALDDTAGKLEILARDVESGTTTDVAMLDHAFRSAQHALANSHYRAASERWTKKEYKQSGYELKATARHLENAADWSEADARKGASESVNEARKVGDKLVKGAKWTDDEVNKAFENIGKKLKELI
jgi:hypothetical protein